jgi:hypothetical protein
MITKGLRAPYLEVGPACECAVACTCMDVYSSNTVPSNSSLLDPRLTVEAGSRGRVV